MAGSSKKSSETNITRISATDTDAKPPKKAKTVAKAEGVAEKPTPRRRGFNPLRPVWTYVRGAWTELRQVRWPDRRSTWGMTGALILFTLVLVVFIIALDYGFSQLFKLILGSN